MLLVSSPDPSFAPWHCWEGGLPALSPPPYLRQEEAPWLEPTPGSSTQRRRALRSVASTRRGKAFCVSHVPTGWECLSGMALGKAQGLGRS